jgi:hypothetical protein|tara:strand:- start:27 stop:569 length:543 start_codon:yes stop_codon:yes gene_type:complete
MTFYRYIPITLLLFFILSCSTPTEFNGNPFDPEEAAEQGFSTPALVFFPAAVNAVLGGSFTLDVYAMEVVNNAGSYIHISYDKTKLSLLSLNQGDFYAAAPEMLFYYEDDADAGQIDIYLGFLGVDSASVSGTGQLASLVFTTLVGGQSTVSFTTESRFADPQNNPIQILGFGDCVVDAQ